jgi:hypothetical protein
MRTNPLGPAAIKVGRGEYSRPRPGKEIQSARGLWGGGKLDLPNPERRIHLNVPTRGPLEGAGLIQDALVDRPASV